MSPMMPMPRLLAYSLMARHWREKRNCRKRWPAAAGDGVGRPPRGGAGGGRLPLPQGRLPALPLLAAVRLFQRHEQREVAEPVGVFMLELLQRRPQVRAASRLKMLPGAGEDALL